MFVGALAPSSPFNLPPLNEYTYKHAMKTPFADESIRIAAITTFFHIIF